MNRPAKEFEAKASAESLRFREELGLKAHDRLDALLLAKHLSIQVECPSSIITPNPHGHVLLRDKSGWSALTLIKNDDILILHNTRHSPERQQSNIFHEIGHIVSGHKPLRFLLAGGLPRSQYSKTEEDEADWMGSVLMLPRPVLVNARKQGMRFETVCAHYCASPQMLQWRINMQKLRLEKIRKSA